MTVLDTSVLSRAFAVRGCWQELSARRLTAESELSCRRWFFTSGYGGRVCQRNSRRKKLYFRRRQRWPREASVSAGLYRSLKRARGREMDLGIAAYALVRESELWTLNRTDFRDIPGLRMTAD